MKSRTLLFLFLWPILWWGFSPAAYCAGDDAPKPRVILTAEQFAELEKVADDIATVHAQFDGTLAADAATIAALKASAAALNTQLAAARESGQRASEEAAKLEADYLLAQATAHRRGWMIFFLWLAIGGLVAWITRGLWTKL